MILLLCTLKNSQVYLHTCHGLLQQTQGHACGVAPCDVICYVQLSKNKLQQIPKLLYVTDPYSKCARTGEPYLSLVTVLPGLWPGSALVLQVYKLQ
jgi:hypothetical protein